MVSLNIRMTIRKTFTLSFLFALVLFIGCSKNNEVGGDPNGLIKLQVRAGLDNFGNNLLKNKMASTFSYSPTQSQTIDYNSDFMLIVELKPISYDLNNNITSTKFLASNKSDTQTPMTNGIAYRLMVFNDNGDFETIRDYIRGQESNTEELLLNKNKTYTFICYSLNSKRVDSLGNILSSVPNGITRNLSNSYITLEGNQDLLFYKNVFTTSTNDNEYLNIVLRHQFNLLRTTIDVGDTGYELAQTIKADFVSKNNIAKLTFASPQGSVNPNDFDLTRLVKEGIEPLTFTYSKVGTSTLNTIATSNKVILNVSSRAKILEIKTLKIGDISNISTITPFNNGVSLVAGEQYNLSVTIVPKDSLYLHSGQQVARINGQIWMRYNLDAPGINNTNSNPDDNNNPTNYLGMYYQWGQAKPAVNIDGVRTIFYTNKSITDTDFFKRWNSGTDGWPKKGSADPCPDGFRLPTTLDYEFLISSAQNSVSWAYIGTFGNDNYALQLTSKRKKTVKLTFPAQGYFTVASDNQALTNEMANNVSDRGRYALARTSYYYIFSSIQVSGVITYGFRYASFEGYNSSAPSVYKGPSNAPVSASIPAHPVRCIAENTNNRIILNDRIEDKDGHLIVY